jgi:dsDNA-specific endonuclease/ATPase MutS2
VEFDVETLSPLYRLRIGEPGNSNALIIAQRLGMSKALIHEAKKHLDGRNQALAKAIDGTLSSRRMAESARLQAQEAQIQAEHEKEEMQRQSQALDDARKEHERWVEWVKKLNDGDKVFVRSFDRVGKVVRMRFSKQTALVAAGAMELEVRLNDLSPPEDDE